MVTATADYIIIIFLFAFALTSVWLKKLTFSAGMTGFVCSLLIYKGCGYAGIEMLAAFFFIGTLATKWQYRLKQQFKVAETDGGRRKASQVLANAGTATISAIIAILIARHADSCLIALAASLAAATADTLASELGTVYGKRFVNILTLKPDVRGLDGVVSLEGTLIGVVGSALIALIYAIHQKEWSLNVYIIVLAGTLGNLADSVIGARLERSGMIKNDVVNFLNTLVAALIALVLFIV